MVDLSYNDGLASASATAAMFLEVNDPVELAIVERCLPSAVISLALVLAEGDPQWSLRWAAAGTDWVTRGEILHEAILFVLRPEEHAVRA